MKPQIKEQLESIAKQLNGKIVYYKCADLHSEHQKIEIIYDKKMK